MAKSHLLAILGLVAALTPLPVAASGGAAPTASDALIVRLQDEGPHAVLDCAARQFARGMPLGAIEATGSDSLDETARRHSLREIKPLFRPTLSPAGTLSAQRRHLAARLARARSRAARGPAARGARGLPDLAQVYRMRFASPAEALAALEELRTDPAVAWAQIDHALDLDRDFDDPYLHSSGAWGQFFPDLWGLDRIRVREAWDQSLGEGVVVAVVDSGLDYDHPDIAANVWVNPGEDLDGNGRIDPGDWNGIDDDDNGFVDDLRGWNFSTATDLDDDGRIAGVEEVGDPDPFDRVGHGTHVSGTIAAIADNGLGIAGVAPGVRLMPVKGFTDEGIGRDSVLWRGVLYAAENGARVINNSWSCGDPCPENPLADEVLELVASLDALVVTSAGNRATDVVLRSPERNASVITVGALGQDDLRSSFSNRGWLLDLVAPGGGPPTPFSVRIARANVLSLRSSGTPDVQAANFVGDAYYRLAGTSMAAPHVAGAAALLRSQRPDLSASDVRRLLRISARDLGAPGRDPETGSGALDAAALLDATLPSLTLRLDAPAPGAIVDPDEGEIEIAGVASGGDLEALTVRLGQGLEPAQFSILEESGFGASPGPEARVLARWDPSGEPIGPYVISVEAQLRDGRVASEQTVVVLERRAPLQLSSGPDGAASPDVSGRRVVWTEAGEPIPGDDGPAIRNRDVMRGGFGARGGAIRPQPVVASFADEFKPQLDGRWLAWMSEEQGQSATALDVCRLPARGEGCQPDRIVADGRSTMNPVLAGRRLVFTASTPLGTDIRLCELGRPGESGFCGDLPGVSDPLGSEVASGFDGRRLTYLDARAASNPRVCTLASDGRACTPEPLTLSYSSPFPFLVTETRLDGELLAFEAFSVFASGLAVCELAEGSTDCNAQIVGPIVSGALPSVSGRRVAWLASDVVAPAAVWFCEWEAWSQVCEPQRVTGFVAPQAEPAIDGDRIVWTDTRVGAPQVFGMELPRLAPVRPARVRPGALLSIPLHGNAPGGDALEIRIEALSGPGLDELGVHLVAAPRRAPAIVWRPTREQVGDYRWQVTATAKSGHFTRRLVEVRVEDDVEVEDEDARPAEVPAPPIRSWWPLPIAFRFGLAD